MRVETIILCRHCRACLSLKSPRVHASVRGRRGGRQHDAGSMHFRCAHLIGVLRGAGNSPDHVIIGTASLGGPRRPAVRRASVGCPFPQTTFGAGPSARKPASSTHIRCRMTPMRRASATIAIDEHHAAKDAAVIDAGLAMSLGNERLQARHPGVTQPVNIAHGSGLLAESDSCQTPEINGSGA